eukprot:gene9197-12405_t
MQSFVQQAHNLYCTVTPSIGGVYSVLPVTRKGILDLPFHISRLADSWNQINGYRIEQTAVVNMDEIVEKVKIIKNKNDESNGAVALCFGKYEKANEQFTYKYFDLSQPSYLNIIPKKQHFIVDFQMHKRLYPTAKYTSWLIERKPLEMNTHFLSSETIIYHDTYETKNENNSLFSDSMIITEGLKTNIFFIDNNNNIITSPSSLILSGSMAKIVKAICQLNNINIIEKEIQLSLFDQWKGAFLTSSTKGIQMIDELIIPIANNYDISQLKNIESYNKNNNNNKITVKNNNNKIYLHVIFDYKISFDSISLNKLEYVKKHLQDFLYDDNYDYNNEINDILNHSNGHNIWTSLK